MANSSPVKAAQAFATLSGGKLPTAEKCVKERVPVFALLQPPNDICKIGANDINHETLQASSTGELTVQPTICQFSITVSSTKERVQDVKNSVTRRLNYVLQTLHNKHIKDGELNVTESLCRVISADNLEQFCLESQVSVTVHDVSLYHSVSNHLVEKLDKHVTVSSPQFTHEPAALEQARRQASLIAVKNCKHKAFELVQAVGAKLGAVLAIKEDYCHEEQLQTADNTAVSRGIQQRLQDVTLHITAKTPAAKKSTSESDEDDKPTTKKTKRAVKDEKPVKESTPVSKESKASKKKSRDAIPEVSKAELTSEAASSSGKKWNMKFSSWNVNGVRAWVEKNCHSYLSAEAPDVFCIQETKCDTDSLPSVIKNVAGYKTYWLAGDKDGYSGTALFTKQEPIKVMYGIDVEKHDKEGRVITAEFEKFYFVTAYVPNSGRGLPRLGYRTTEWDVDFREYLKKLDAVKPVILCGDLNVAHLEIDLANPKTNRKSAGFTDEEREQFSQLLKNGFIDSFRHLYPDVTGAYSYWTYMSNARAKNVGWRLDYFVISERLKDSLCDSIIRKDVLGSDHCPITLLMHM